MDFIEKMLYVPQHDARVLENLESLAPPEKFELFLESIKHNFLELFFRLANDCLDYDRFTVLITSVFYKRIDYARMIIENTEFTEKNIEVLTLLSEQLPAPWLIEYLNSYPEWYFKYSNFSDRWTTIPLTQEQVDILVDYYVETARQFGNTFSKPDREKLLYLAPYISDENLDRVVDELHTIFVDIIKSSDLEEEVKNDILEDSLFEAVTEFLGIYTYNRYTQDKEDEEE